MSIWNSLKILRWYMGSWRAVVNVVVGFSYSMAFHYGWKLHDYMGFQRPVTMKRNRTSGRIDFAIDGSRWSIAFPCARGPYKFSHVVDSEGFDVTDDIKAVMGPGKNFYGISSTPSLLGYDSLTFHDYCGGMKHFSKDSIIEI